MCEPQDQCMRQHFDFLLFSEKNKILMHRLVFRLLEESEVELQVDP